MEAALRISVKAPKIPKMPKTPKPPKMSIPTFKNQSPYVKGTKFVVPRKPRWY
jgi:hypothetical protein